MEEELKQRFYDICENNRITTNPAIIKRIESNKKILDSISLSERCKYDILIRFEAIYFIRSILDDTNLVINEILESKPIITTIVPAWQTENGMFGGINYDEYIFASKYGDIIIHLKAQLETWKASK